VDDAFEQRAAARRASWSGGVVRSLDALEESGVEFWAKAPPAAKLSAMLQLLADAWVIGGKQGPPPRFQGSVVGVGRFER
jgi:hypothetical protein